NKRTIALLILACTWIGATEGHKLSDTLPPCGGMAEAGKERYVIVQDLKANEPGERFGLVRTDDGAHYTAMETDWSAVGGELSNDLESICPLDGAPGHYLSSESGYFQGKYGRVYWLQIENDKVKILSKFQLPQLPQEIEGIATKRLDAERWLVLLG